MKKSLFLGLGMVMALLVSGCSTALVSNEARCTVTAPDGTVTERFAKNNIKAFGDRAVEQNLKGSLADATEEDLSAGIQESTQKSESGAVVEFLGKTVETLGRIGEAYFGNGKARTPDSDAANPVAVAESTPADDGTGSTGNAGTDVSTGDEETVYSSDGYDGVPGSGGEGVYGQPGCSRCRAYKASHTDVKIINIKTESNSSAMWAALKKRGFAEGSVKLPVLITADGFTLAAK